MKEKPTKPTTSNQHDPDMLDEYDFSAGIRGKYAERYFVDKNLIQLDEDVVKMFPDAKFVNDALRALGKLIAEHQKNVINAYVGRVI